MHPGKTVQDDECNQRCDATTRGTAIVNSLLLTVAINCSAIDGKLGMKLLISGFCLMKILSVTSGVKAAQHHKKGHQEADERGSRCYWGTGLI